MHTQLFLSLLNAIFTLTQKFSHLSFPFSPTSYSRRSEQAAVWVLTARGINPQHINISKVLLLLSLVQSPFQFH